MEAIVKEIKNLNRDWHEFKSNHQKNWSVMQTELMEQKERLDTMEFNLNSPTLKEQKANQGMENAFREYLRKGETKTLESLEMKMLSSTDGESGGYFVTPKVQHNIVSELETYSVLRRLASIERISTDSLEIIDDYENSGAGWTHETATRPETNAPKLHNRRIMVHELYAQPRATQKLIDDAAINIESWLSSKLANDFAKLENESFVKGNGVGKPKGFLSYENGKEWAKIEVLTTKEKDKLAMDDMVKLIYLLPEQYLVKASILTNRSTLQYLRLLKDNNGCYLWQNSLDAAQPNRLMGIPVFECNEMPTLASGNTAVALADFKAAYQIIDRQSIKVLRDPYTEKPFVKFYATKRVGGDVKNFHAIKLLKIA